MMSQDKIARLAELSQGISHDDQPTKSELMRELQLNGMLLDAVDVKAQPATAKSLLASRRRLLAELEALGTKNPTGWGVIEAGNETNEPVSQDTRSVDTKIADANLEDPVIALSMTDHRRWDAFRLDDLLDMDCVQFFNERPSGYGDMQGEWFMTPTTNAIGPDGGQYRVIFRGTHGNDHAPGSSHNTDAYLYRVEYGDDIDRYGLDLAELEAMPEELESDDTQDWD